MALGVRRNDPAKLLLSPVPRNHTDRPHRGHMQRRVPVHERDGGRVHEAVERPTRSAGRRAAASALTIAWVGAVCGTRRMCWSSTAGGRSVQVAQPSPSPLPSGARE